MSLEPLGAGWRPLIERAVEGLSEATGAASEGASSPRFDGSGPWAGAVGQYLDELVTWNRRTDLTAARSPEELVDLTVAEAAIVAAASDEGSFVDVGSGAGAPGLVLALLRPDISMVLVEPREKRVAFLRSVIGRLHVANASVQRSRSDALPGGSCDTAIARATLPPPEWVLEGARLARHGVWVFLAREETPNVPSWVADLDISYEWPLTAVPRRAVRFVRKPAGAPRTIE